MSEEPDVHERESQEQNVHEEEDQNLRQQQDEGGQEQEGGERKKRLRKSQLTRLIFFQGSLVVKRNLPQSRLMKEAGEGKLDGKLKGEDEVKKMVLETAKEHTKKSLFEEEGQDSNEKKGE